MVIYFSLLILAAVLLLHVEVARVVEKLDKILATVRRQEGR